MDLIDFHVRASSRKEKINLNKALIFFMLHGSRLYGWCENSTEGKNQLTLVNSLSDDSDPSAGNAFCSNYYYISVFKSIWNIKPIDLWPYLQNTSFDYIE